MAKAKIDKKVLGEFVEQLRDLMPSIQTMADDLEKMRVEDLGDLNEALQVASGLNRCCADLVGYLVLHKAMQDDRRETAAKLREELS